MYVGGGSFSDRMTEEIRCSTGRLSSPIQGSTAHPHMRGGGGGGGGRGEGVKGGDKRSPKESSF